MLLFSGICKSGKSPSAPPRYRTEVIAWWSWGSFKSRHLLSAGRVPHGLERLLLLVKSLGTSPGFLHNDPHRHISPAVHPSCPVTKSDGDLPGVCAGGDPRNMLKTVRSGFSCNAPHFIWCLRAKVRLSPQFCVLISLISSKTRSIFVPQFAYF